MASVVKSLKLKESTSDSLELSWKRQVQREIDGYRVFYHEMRRQKVYYGTFLDSNATGYNIRSLSADTEYKICLAAYDHGNRNKIKDKHCIQATTSSWHIPVSVGSSIGALVALLIILGIVLYARCHNRKHKNRKQGSSDVNQNQFHSMFSSETDASNYPAMSEFSDVTLHINNAGWDVTNDALTEVSSNAERKEIGLSEEDNGIRSEVNDAGCSVCYEIQQCPYCEVVDESSMPLEVLGQLEEKMEVRKWRMEEPQGSGSNAAPAVNQNNGHLYTLVSDGEVYNNVTNRDGVQSEAGDKCVTSACNDVIECDKPTEQPKMLIGNKRCQRHVHRCDVRAPLIRHNSSPCCVQNSAIVPISGILESDEY